MEEEEGSQGAWKGGNIAPAARLFGPTPLPRFSDPHGHVLQKSTATIATPTERQTHQLRRTSVQRQQTTSQPRVCKQEVLSTPRDLLVRMTNAGDKGREAALPLAARPRALSSHGHWTGPPQCPLPPPAKVPARRSELTEPKPRCHRSWPCKRMVGQVEWTRDPVVVGLCEQRHCR